MGNSNNTLLKLVQKYYPNAKWIEANDEMVDDEIELENGVHIQVGTTYIGVNHWNGTVLTAKPPINIRCVPISKILDQLVPQLNEFMTKYKTK